MPGEWLPLRPSGSWGVVGLGQVVVAHAITHICWVPDAI